MSSLDGLSKKERLRRENDALLLEAKKSDVDKATGRVRCLSCGSLFPSLTALAAHLRKHGGVNAIEYRPRRVVGASHVSFGGSPVERPAEVKLGEFLSTSGNGCGNNYNTADVVSQHHKVPKQDVNTPTRIDGRGATGKKRNKLSPLKRSILIQQVLSLTQKLGTLRTELSEITAHRTTRPAPVESDDLRKQVKRVQGCINSTKSELQMALNVINQKFTFRQLVMLEFLTKRMDLPLTVSGSFGDKVEEECKESDTVIQKVEPQQLLSPSVEVLYDEAETLQQVIEAAHEAKWTARVEADAKRLIETRRDLESGKIYIKKPLFVEASGLDASCTGNDLAVGEKNAGWVQGDDDHDERTEIKEMQLYNRDAKEVNNVDDSSLSSQETVSVDDDMRGFGDVLMEWAKKTQHNTKAPSRSQPYQLFEDDGDSPEALEEFGEGDNLNKAEKPLSPADEETTGVQIVRARKGMNSVCNPGPNNNSGNDPPETEVEWSYEPAVEGGVCSHCVFIKPLLGVPLDTDIHHRSSPGKRKKSDASGKAPYQFPQHQQSCDHNNQPCVRGAASSAVPNNANDSETHCSLDDAVHLLLTKLSARQHEHMKNTHGQDSQRWMVSGFGEVSKHLQRGSVKLIIVAKNLDESIQPKLSELQTAAHELGVPVVHALTRKKIGQIYHVRKKMSVVALFDYHDFEILFSTIVQLNSAAAANI